MDSLGVTLIQYFIGELDGFRQNMGVSVGEAIRPFARVVTTLYVVIVGYRILMGKVGGQASSWAVSILLLLLIQSMVLESDGYSRWVFSPLMGAALDLASYFSGSSGTEFAHVGRLDEAVGAIVSTVDQLEPTGNFLTNSMAYIKVGIASFILLLFVAGMYLVYLALTVLALFSMYVLMMIGPAFLFFAAFPETRFMAKTWLRTFCQYALWLVLLGLVMAISIPGVEAAAASLANWDVVRDGVFTQAFGMTLLFTGIVTYFLLKTSDLSSALSGGVGMNAGIAGGMLAGGIGAMGSAVSAGGAGAMGAMQAGASNVGRIGAYGAGRAAGAAVGQAIRGFSSMRGIN